MTSIASYLMQNAGINNAYYNQLGGFFGSKANAAIAPRCIECNEPGMHYHEMGIKAQAQEKEKSTMKIVRDYIESHKDMLFTIAVVILADHFLFGGKFRARIEQMVEQWIDKATAFKLKQPEAQA